MTTYSYVAKTTPTKWRTIRMTILQVVINSCEIEICDSLISEVSKNYFFMFIAMPLGSALSGKLLMMSPIGGNGQLHNNAFIFTMSTIGCLITFLWVIFIINEKDDKKMFDFEFGDENNVNQELEKEKNTKKVNPLKLLFNFNNVKDIVKTCIKKRDNRVRFQIWLIFFTMLCTTFLNSAPGVFQFQFVEKIYYWNAETYGYFSAIGTISHAFFTITCAPILIRVSFKTQSNNLVFKINNNS